MNKSYKESVVRVFPKEDIRQAAIDEIEERKNANGYSDVALISELNRLEGYIMQLPSVQPDNDTIHLQKEQAYLQGWEEGRKALRKEMWEDGRDRLD